MSKFYGRYGGVRISQMPFKHGEKLPVDILKVERQGEKTEFSMRVHARDARIAGQIFLGAIRSAFVGVTISDANFPLFMSKGYYLLDFRFSAELDVELTYSITGIGHFFYYD